MGFDYNFDIYLTLKLILLNKKIYKFFKYEILYIY